MSEMGDGCVHGVSDWDAERRVYVCRACGHDRGCNHAATAPPADPASDPTPDARDQEIERLRMALEKIEQLSGRGTCGNIATLVLHPEYAWMIGDWIADDEIVNDAAFRAALATAPASREAPCMCRDGSSACGACLAAGPRGRSQSSS